MILVLNCGSQSIKWKVFDSKLKTIKQNKLEVLNSGDYSKLLEEELSKLKNFEILKIGHRVVHGGKQFRKPTQITEPVLAELKKISHFASLHNPYNIMGIETCRKIFGDTKNFAVFDTDFFKDLPPHAFTYALPENIVKDFGFRKYGFHGISHEYVAKEAAKKLKKSFEKLKIITCHLGGGASIAAIKNGKAVDTSMGFTPMQGLVMMTRPGDMDPGVVLEIVKKYGPDKAEDILNKESGIKGICGEGEFLNVLKQMAEGSERSRRAFDVFVYSIKKYIGAYFAILGGCDALVFTGAIGAGVPKTRDEICRNKDILKKTKVLAIETDEELAIANKIL